MSSYRQSEGDWQKNGNGRHGENVPSEKKLTLKVDDKYSPQRTSRGRQDDELDKGYAWVICFASCMLYAQTDGVCFSMGVLLPVFVEAFGSSLAATAWISSVLMGSMLLSGPLVSYLVSRFGSRAVCVVGAFMAASGSIISMYATSIGYLICSLGGLTGFGFGCMMIPALVSVTTWFQKRQALAVGIAICGAGVGMFLYSTIVTLLVGHFGLSGCFLILGGILFNGCLFGLLLRAPPRPPSSSLSEHSQYSKSHFSFAIFKNIFYDMFLFACFMFSLGFFPVFMFMVTFAENKLHIELNDAAFLLTIIAICNVCGRLVCAILLDRPCINKFLALGTSILMGGIGVGCLVLCTDYNMVAAVGAVYGYAGGFAFVGLPVVMAQIVTPQEAEISSGFFVFSLGLAALLGIPSAGMLVDFSGGDYTLLFLICGFALCISASLMFAICVSKRRRSAN